MSVVEEVLAGNRAYAERFDQGDAQLPPNKPLVVLTCIDARLHPESFLGLQIGDAHIVRNAGGRASDDALRSIVISSALLGTRECMVVHHTDCGMLTFTNEAAREMLGPAAADVDFMPFTDVEESTRDDVAAIRSHPLIPDGMEVTGWVYDVTTGRLSSVD